MADQQDRRNTGSGGGFWWPLANPDLALIGADLSESSKGKK
jgi:hypothetical protein